MADGKKIDDATIPFINNLAGSERLPLSNGGVDAKTDIDKISDYVVENIDLDGKMDKVPAAAEGSNAVFDANGQVIGGADVDNNTEALPTTTPPSESPNGISENQKEVNEDVTSNISNLYNVTSANTEAIANFASASMSVLAPIGTIPEDTETRIAWIEESHSTDIDILNYVTDDFYFELKKQDFRYQLQGSLLVYSTGNGQKTITFRTRLQDDDTLLNTYTDTIAGGNNRPYRIELGPTFIDNPLEQLDIYITWECTDDEVDVVAGGAFIIGDSVGAGGIVSSFSDDAFSIYNETDPTKIWKVNLGDFITGDAPTQKPQRNDGILALLDNVDADLRARYLRGINGLILENYNNTESVGATLIMGENGFVSLKKIDYPETILQDSSSTDVLLELNTNWYDLGVSVTPNFDITEGVGEGIAMCQSLAADRDMTFSFRVMIDGVTSGNVFTHIVRPGETSLYNYSELLEFPILDGEEVRFEANCNENNDGTILGSLVPTSIRITSLVNVTETPPNIIANQGVGLLADRPATGLIAGDVYVATNTNLKYTALTATTWDAGVDLIEKQFITDLTTDLKNLYQFNGTSIIEPNKTWEKTGNDIDYKNGNVSISMDGSFFIIKDSGGDISAILGLNADNSAFLQLRNDLHAVTSLISGKTGVNSYINNGGNFGFGLNDPNFQAEFLESIGIRNTPDTDTNNSPVMVRDETTGELKQFLQLKQTSVASASSITPTGNYRENEHNVTSLAANLTINVPSGTAIDNNTLVIRIDDDGTARTLTFNAIYTGDLPTTTTVGSTLYCGFSYNSSKSKWQLIGLKEV